MTSINKPVADREVWCMMIALALPTTAINKIGTTLSMSYRAAIAVVESLSPCCCPTEHYGERPTRQNNSMLLAKPIEF